MSLKHLWWGPFTSTFCEHWFRRRQMRSKIVCGGVQKGWKETKKVKEVVRFWGSKGATEN